MERQHLRLPLLVEYGQVLFWVDQIPELFHHQCLLKKSIDTIVWPLSVFCIYFLTFLSNIAGIHFVMTCLQLFFFYFFKFFFLIGINSMQAQAATTRQHKEIKAYKKSVQKEPGVKRCLLILDLKPFRSKFKEKHSIGREFQSLAVEGRKLLTQTSL